MARCMWSPECLELLLKHGADPNQPEYDEYQLSPLADHCLQSPSLLQQAKLLIEYGADVTCKSFYGLTMLHENVHASLVPILIRKGLDINAKDRDNWTPLYRAMMASRMQVVEALMRYRPRLNYYEVDWLQKVTPDLYRRWVRGRWTVLKCLVRLLTLHKQAVISANHPMRKLTRGEFSVREPLTCC